MPNRFQLSDYGRDISTVRDEDFYRFACAYYLHQDKLSWSRTQILFAVEAAVLTAALSQSQRTWIAVAALVLGSVLVFLIWRLIQRDWEIRDQYLNFFDKFHKFNERDKGVSAILCKRRSLVMARWSGQVRFCLLPYARIVGIIRQARTAVKAERSEFILSLDGGRSRPYRFCPGIG
jgi:hypothetical protein